MRVDGNKPIRVIYLGPDSKDAAVVRRVTQLIRAGADVRAFAFRRSRLRQQPEEPDITVLGEIGGGASLSRIKTVLSAVWLLLREGDSLRSADVIYCRNIDMALLGVLYRTLSRNKAIFVLEVLDIHPFMVGMGRKARMLRWVERKILAKCSLLVLSSERFYSDYFNALQGYRGSYHILENKISGVELAFPVPAPLTDERLVIGYFGTLRCASSLRLLRGLAMRFPHNVEIRLAGVTRAEHTYLLDEIAALPNCSVLGPYRYPQDLPELYGAVNLNWCMDLDGGWNAKLLLPNRIYEGGAFAVPALAEESTETGFVVSKRGLGMTIKHPSDDTLAAFVEGLDMRELSRIRQLILEGGTDRFYDFEDHKVLLSVIGLPRKNS